MKTSRYLLKQYFNMVNASYTAGMNQSDFVKNSQFNL